MTHNLNSTITARWPHLHEDSTVTADIREPDGESLAPAPTPVFVEGQGWTVEFVGTKPGRYLVAWTDSTLAATYVDTVEVWPADPRFLISVDDAAEGLRWRPADLAKNRGALLLYIAAATEVLEDITGALLLRTIVQPADGGRTGIPLWERPSEVLKVEVNGQEIDGFVPNLNAGIVYLNGVGGMFPWGRQNVTVTYRVGAEQIHPSVQLAARELVRHLWQVGQQAPGASAVTQDSNTVFTPSGFAVPKRVIELAQNQYRLPGMS